MTDEEKIKKFELIQKYFWKNAKEGNLLQSTHCAALIRLFEIPSPSGENPEGA